MTRGSIAGALAIAIAIMAVAAACREGDPAIDPKTPANSPIPKIERPDDPVVAPKAPKDGG